MCSPKTTPRPKKIPSSISCLNFVESHSQLSLEVSLHLARQICRKQYSLFICHIIYNHNLSDGNTEVAKQIVFYYILKYILSVSLIPLAGNKSVFLLWGYCAEESLKMLLLINLQYVKCLSNQCHQDWESDEFIIIIISWKPFLHCKFL